MSTMTAPSPASNKVTRRVAVGAELQATGGTHFRVWAPKCKSIDVIIEGDATPHPLAAEADGYFSGLIAEAKAGTLYKYRVDGDKSWPDVASHYQPKGVHGPSQVVDALHFKWTDANWKGVPVAGQVLYEMHIGTFTPQGTWRAAIEKLSFLKEVGVTVLEVLPVAEFAGEHGWGYDGVDQYAPFHAYGTPDDFRAFVDAAHKLGLGVILDLVYNHFGPDGNYVGIYSEDYFHHEMHTDWGTAINFDGKNSKPVRDFFVGNALYWITEFHLDGFRFDATQAIVDKSEKHLLAEITEKCRAAAKGRELYLINENEPQNTQLVQPADAGGYGMSANWNDDFHHSALVAVTGHDEAYYVDHPGTPQEFISSAKYGYLYQGQRYTFQGKRRGTTSLEIPPTSFVHYLQNHDQIANSGRGYRLHQITSPGEFKAMTALLLLMPQTPMLFQGQEWATNSPWNYFADHNEELAKLVCKGRAKELAAFPSIATPAMQACLPDPDSDDTFTRSKIKWEELDQPLHKGVLKLHKDLLKLRRDEPTFRRVQKRGDLDGAVLGPDSFVLRYFAEGGEDRLLIVNLGRDLHLDPAPEPLLAPPMGRWWTTLLTTEDPSYGGSGTAALDTEDEGWWIPGRTAVVLAATADESAKVKTRIREKGSAQAPRTEARQ